MQEGIAALEDKIVQRSVVMVLNPVYEEVFRNFSFGFRPGRGQHQALDAVAVGICHKEVHWILDADLRKFFDTVDHDCLMRFVRHRIGDKRILRLIYLLLKAGLESYGRRHPTRLGDLTASCQHLPALRAGSVGRPLAVQGG